MDISNADGTSYLKTIIDGSIDLVLTDPPYIISKETGMDIHYKTVKANEEQNITCVKTEEEWHAYKTENSIENDDNKANFIKYGTVYGKKYCVQTDYGEWDSNFTIDELEVFIKEFYNKLKKGGTLIMFIDIWKLTTFKDLFEKYKFKQIRFIEWIKTNPQPRNRLKRQ